MVEVLDRRVGLVTGKGGVGRSTLTAAIARSGAARGKRILVTEIAEPDGAFSPLARLFSRETLPADPVLLASDAVGGGEVHGCVLYPRRGHEAFFRTVIPVGAVVKAAMNSGALRKLLDTAPSFREMGIFYHIFTLLEATTRGGRHLYDHVLVDMPASGHTLGLTGLPERLLALMPTGPIAEAMHLGRPYFTDPALCAAWVVALPEVLPITEALELIEGLQEHDTPIGGILMNRVLPDPFSTAERAELAPVLTPDHYGYERFVGVVQSERALADLLERSPVQVKTFPELPATGPELAMALALHVGSTR